MTTYELRDWHAREDQRRTRGQDTVVWTDEDCRLADKFGIHPYPPTLDGAASTMPEGWTWGRDETEWWATHSCTREIPSCVNTGDEIHDRFLLAKQVKEAMNAHPR